MITENLRAPHIIEATYRIVTPMFIGDAQQEASGISPQSVKGALRFWWRALNWGKIRSDTPSDRAALEKLHNEESALFGSTAEEGSVAKFTIRVTANTKLATLSNPKLGVQYLLGQGLYHFNQGYLRSALAENSSVKVFLTLKAKLPKQSHEAYEKQKQQLIDAALILGILGGLGSRARKGFGSLAIQSLSIDSKEIAVPKSTTELKTLIKPYGLSTALPPFTALSNETRIDVSLQGTNPMDVLNAAGEEQQLYRSYGRNGMVGRKEAEQNFVADHDLLASVIRNRTQPKTIPARSVFGLPHNYFFTSLPAPHNKAEFTPSMQDRSRRASPLFIHVHQFPNLQVVLLQALLPATFLPDRDTLEFKMGNRTADKVSIRFNENSMIDWKVIHDYMDRFAQRESIL